MNTANTPEPIDVPAPAADSSTRQALTTAAHAEPAQPRDLSATTPDRFTRGGRHRAPTAAGAAQPAAAAAATARHRPTPGSADRPTARPPAQTPAARTRTEAAPVPAHPHTRSHRDEPGLRITMTDLPGATVVLRPAGDLDHDRVPELEHALARALARRPRRLVVDLSAVRFCDTATLHLLFKAHRAARRTHAALLLAQPSAPARRVLEITEMDTVLPTLPTLRDALTRTPGTDT
ncbi:STAS domain-containing protein [Kitasatospora cineracea]|uniref:STAS domain-containing protein n=1 Tax=Kitasatospora cineracea TaxID=88074 RepID=UPI003689CFA3